MKFKNAPRKQSFASRIGCLWGVAGVVALLVWAVGRVLPHALESLETRLTVLQWAALIVWCAYMLYSEGYRGFQKGFAPFVVRQAWYILHRGTFTEKLLAPLFCVGYFGAGKKRQMISYIATAAIILLVTIVHQLPQPWRGILDWGVVLGLSYGVICVVIMMILQIRSAKLQR